MDVHDKCESTGGPVREPPIPTERRRHLARLAEALADRVEKEVPGDRERNLLRRMVSNLLD